MKLLKYILAILIFASSNVASAGALDDAFSTMTSSASDATAYKTKTRFGVSGGSYNLRFRPMTIQLVSIDPPNFSGGCGGLSAHFGGFSFINGDQITQLLEQVAQGAVGYVFQIAVTQLCPLCGEVLATIQEWAQKAAALAADSCKFSYQLAKGVTSPAVNAKESYCNERAQHDGEADDWLMGNIVCGTKEDAEAKVDEVIANTNSVAELCSHEATANKTWCALTHLGLANPDAAATDDEEVVNFVATALMSYTGTTVKGHLYSPTIESEQLLDVLMCGIGWNAQPPESAVYKFCDQRQPGDFKLWVCDEPKKCLAPTDVVIDDFMAGAAIGTGFITLVENLLSDAIRKAGAAGEELTSAQKDLITLAPFPLYQVINMGATYPALAEQIVNDNSVAIAYLLSSKYITHVLRESLKAAGDDFMAEMQMPQEWLKDVMTAQTDMEASMTIEAHKIDFLANRQKGIMSQVTDANKSILRSVFALGLSGVDFARGTVQR